MLTTRASMGRSLVEKDISILSGINAKAIEPRVC
jgi:hypothetical protein